MAPLPPLMSRARGRRSPCLSHLRRRFLPLRHSRDTARSLHCSSPSIRIPSPSTVLAEAHRRSLSSRGQSPQLPPPPTNTTSVIAVATSSCAATRRSSPDTGSSSLASPDARSLPLLHHRRAQRRNARQPPRLAPFPASWASPASSPWASLLSLPPSSAPQSPEHRSRPRPTSLRRACAVPVPTPQAAA